MGRPCDPGYSVVTSDRSYLFLFARLASIQRFTVSPKFAGVVRVLFVRPLVVAGVVEHRDVVLLVDLAVAGILEPVLDPAHPPAALLVAHAPGVRERLHLGVRPLGHRRRDPLVDRLAPLELPEVVLEVLGVLGELVGPRSPVARPRRLRRHRAVVIVRFLELLASPLSHHSPCTPLLAPAAPGRSHLRRTARCRRRVPTARTLASGFFGHSSTPRSRAQARFLRAEPTWAMCTTWPSPWFGSP